MSQPKRRLGRALSDMGVQALLSQSQEDISEDQIKHLPIDKVQPNANQPRKSFPQTTLDELSESIKAHGVLQPIIVMEKSGKYEIIAGERRYRAATQARLQTIPAIVKDLDQLAAESIAIIENIQREALNPLDQALAYARLIDTYKLSHDEVASKVNKSRSSISNMLRLNKLHPEVKQHLKEGHLEMGHARALLAAPDEKQPQLAHTIIEKQLSVRQVEQLVKQKPSSPVRQPAKDTHWITNTLKQFNIQAKVRGTHEKGSITLNYKSAEDLERLLASLTAKKLEKSPETT